MLGHGPKVHCLAGGTRLAAGLFVELRFGAFRRATPTLGSRALLSAPEGGLGSMASGIVHLLSRTHLSPAVLSQSPLGAGP